MRGKANRILPFFALFFAFMATMISLCIALNLAEPNLKNGSPLPAGLGRMPFSLSDPVLDRENGDIHYSFPLAETAEPLAVTLCEMDYFELFLNGAPVARYAPGDAFQRVRSVPVDAASIGGGALHLTIHTPSAHTLGTGAQRLATKILLGSASAVDEFVNVSHWIALTLVGMEGMLILVCLLLYIGKTSEKYLLAICFLAVLTASTTLLDSTIPILHLDKQTHMFLRALMVIMLIECTAMLCLELTAAQLPPGLVRVITGWPFKAALACVIVLFVATNSLPLYTLRFSATRWLFAGPVVCLLLRNVRKARSNLFLLVSYALCEALFCYPPIGQIFSATRYGLVNSYFRIGSFAYLFMLLACLIVTASRFSGKFHEAEEYSARLLRLNTNLDALVESRTAALHQEQAQKRTMLLNIFHDLRSPIFIMRTRLENLRGKSDEDESALNMLRARARYLERLSEDLFLYAKLEGKDVLFDEDRVDLTALLCALAESETVVARQRGIDLTCQTERSCAVWGDDCRIQQAFQNLIDNALDYTPPGGQVSVSMAVEAENCVVRVRDTGKGIRQEDLPLVFERYFRSVEHKNKSTGLGLAIAREILLAHHGGITVSSERGKGTVFTAFLPRMNERPAQPD